MTPTARKVAPLLFGSGFCALIYQIAWMREFRLVFGASTAASAAVLAIFIGGLGVGGLVLGRRADRRSDPLFFYAQLEALVSVSAALTPLLLWLVRKAYTAAGGTVTMGLAGGTVARVLLATLVLAVPTVVMGGTLPAASRAVESDSESDSGSRDGGSRRSVALLYGVNTLGAVTGCLLANFVLLEVFGTRLTLWMACLVNLLVAVIAVRTARELGDITQPTAAGAADPAGAADAAGAADEAGAADAKASEPAPAEVAAGAMAKPADDAAALAPAWFVLGSAGVVGFAFFLMELVWYRMLGPLLGGTVFTFGLILALALLGIGLGGAFYAIVGNRKPPTLLSFSWTCLLEALFIAVPFALGDRLAIFSLSLRTVGNLGFSAHVFSWTLVAGVVVVPAAFVSGVQFPMLIALLGRGRRDVGRQVGLTYAWNTVGAIAGSLGGGFGLLPALSAPGCWRAVAYMLGALGLCAIVLSVRASQRFVLAIAPAVVLVLTVALLRAEGPTSAWRHAGIGAGRASLKAINSPNATRNFLHASRRHVAWEKDGVESSVAVVNTESLSFVVNGKSDGNAIIDAPTQVGFGMVGGMLHPGAKSSIVIGLGTGSTAGWLGAIPAMERVDVVELEPAILRVARECSVVNHNALDNPRVHVQIGDAREVLLTTPRHYDLVLSEPSNPYRAGIASLFTHEFYQAVDGRLNQGGIFLQWVQAYEIDAQTLRTIYATVASVFPVVETWELAQGDLLLVATHAPLRYDLAGLEARIQQEPFRSAFPAVWRASDAAGFLSHFVATPSLASAIARDEGAWLNTDDQSPVEFGFARSVGALTSFSPDVVRHIARARGEHVPTLVGPPITAEQLEDGQINATLASTNRLLEQPYHTAEQRLKVRAFNRLQTGDFAGALEEWRQLNRPPSGLVETLFYAACLAEVGDEHAVGFADKVRPGMNAEADIIMARLRLKQGKFPEATALLQRALLAMRTDPWVGKPSALRALRAVEPLFAQDPSLGGAFLEALSQPFAAYSMNEERHRVRFELSRRVPDKLACVEALKHFEPWPPWNESFLTARLDCYRRSNHPLTTKANRDLVEFAGMRPLRFDWGLVPESAQAPPSAAPDADSAP
jgi:spermidine synthase